MGIAIMKETQRFYRTMRHDVKATALHGWPYLKYRYMHKLPPVFGEGIRTPASGPLEIHLLTCARDFQMAVWSAFSLTVMCKKQLPLVIHEDGTLSEKMFATLRRFFPDARIIMGREATAKSEDTYRCFPRLLYLRRRLKHFWKLTDFPLFCSAPRFVILDSDQLFFSTPYELLRGPLDMPHLFLRDLFSTYELSAVDVEARLAQRVACGLGNVDKEVIDFDRMERFLCSSKLDIDHCDIWIEQTLWALECGASGVEYLPETYTIALGSGCGCRKAKHYIGGPSRDYFYAEGIPAMERAILDQV